MVCHEGKLTVRDQTVKLELVCNTNRVQRHVTCVLYLQFLLMFMGLNNAMHVYGVLCIVTTG